MKKVKIRYKYFSKLFFSSTTIIILYIQTKCDHKFSNNDPINELIEGHTSDGIRLSLLFDITQFK